MGFTTINNDERTDKGVSGLSSTPNLTASALQQRFDSLANLALDKLIKHIEELESTTAGSYIGTPYGKLTAVLTTLFQKIAAIVEERTAENIDERVTEIEDTTIPDLKNRISATQETMTNNNTTYMGLISENQTNINNLTNRIDSADEYTETTIVPILMEVDNRSTLTETALKDSSGNLINVNSALNGINTQIENAQEDISNIESDLSSLEQSITETDELLSETKTKLSTAETNIAKVQENVTALETQITTDIQSAVTSLQVEIEDAKAVGKVVDGRLLLNARATITNGRLTL